ncbi:MAG: tyrosine-type recombinase/integrase [Nocardioides marinisabuli]|uniref:tyrosine-type recombinase/integrase n=1 Tax=Nocardioides marinisabuli TaxID=419476 RepID=UPI00321ADE5C
MRPGPNNKHALPSHAPTRENADYGRLLPKDGPWMAPRWAVMPHVGAVRSEPFDCAVRGCGRDGYLQSFCYAHWHQWRRAGKPTNTAAWARQHAKQPVERLRANRVTNLVVDFDGLPDLVAREIRYVVGEKVSAGQWTPNRHLLEIFTSLAETARSSGVASLLDRDPDEWVRNMLPLIKGRQIRRDADGYMKTFFALLHRAVVADPWAEPTWLWVGMFDGLVHEGAWANRGQNIHWTPIAQEWLREPIKRYARTCLTSGARAWGTVLTWSNAAAHLAAYLSEEGVDDPSLLDRNLMLDYLASVNETHPSKHRLAGVNTIAALLATLQEEGLATYGSPVFLRYAENAVRKTQLPKPYPADVIERIDRNVLTDPELERSAKMMLQLTRWGGLRIGELVNCPTDALRHNGSKGYWIHYYMSKTRNWRSFPVPDDLARALREHQRWVRETYGQQANYLFPSPTRSKAERGLVVPWSPAGFRGHIRAAFLKHKITESAITGEQVTGGEIHRYRHTVGTTLLNNGWTQREVQEFLGHESGQMTANYAEILDDTLIRKVREFQEARANGQDPDAVHPGVERMRARFAYELPDGGCTLPASQSCETRDNPCTGCAFFESGGAAIRPVHDDRRKRLKLHIDQTDDPREKALNQRALDEVDRILGRGN